VSSLKYPGLEHQPDSGEQQKLWVQQIRRILRTQFGRPTGLLGKAAGVIMAHRQSNIDRIHWTLSLLKVQPQDRVLEVGIGPGVAIEQLAGIANAGFVAGIDHSDEMISQATRRNSDAVRAGRVFLCRASASALPRFDTPFDKIFTINSIHFWNDPVACLRNLRGLLRPGGVMAVTLQARTRSATDETTEILGKEIAAKLSEAGFFHCEVAMKKATPAAMVCVLATN
jgi:ubiquinone/menaquinone biosynthesis C-methylase UbiE